MAPSKNFCRGRPLRSSPVAAKSQAVANHTAVVRAVMGPPPAECSIVQNFEDEPILQQVIRQAMDSAGQEHLSNMECRIEASDKMLQEVQAMVRDLQQLPATGVLPAPPPAVPVPMAMSAEGGGARCSTHG